MLSAYILLPLAVLVAFNLIPGKTMRFVAVCATAAICLTQAVTALFFHQALLIPGQDVIADYIGFDLFMDPLSLLLLKVDSRRSAITVP